MKESTMILQYRIASVGSNFKVFTFSTMCGMQTPGDAYKKIPGHETFP